MRPMKALILVDLQNDFLTGGALPVPVGDAVIPVANILIDYFDLVVATQDWHPADHGSFAVNHPGKKPGDIITLNGLDQILWPVHCVRYTSGAAFAGNLDTNRIDRVFQKGTDPDIDSYSGFFDNGHKKDTGMGNYLKETGVTEVYILGLATDYCVRFTALDARRLDFTTFLVENGCRGVDLNPGDIHAAIEDMKKAGVTVLTSEDIIGR